jgi:putative membrane protein
MKLLFRWVISGVSIFIAAWLVPGIRVQGTAWIVYAVMAVVLGLINATIRPILKFLTCPLIILTFGLFIFVINGLMLWLASFIAVGFFHVGFYIEGFWSAFLGALIISLVSLILNTMIQEAGKEEKTESRI